MKKKAVLMIVLTFCALSLIGCANTEEYEKQIEDLTNKVENLEKENAELKEELNTSLVVKNNEPIILSGKIIVGTDIPAGSYDIKTEDDSDYTHVMIFDDEEAEENFKYNLISGKSGETVKSYMLRDGNILSMDKNMQFTKIN